MHIKQFYQLTHVGEHIFIFFFFNDTATTEIYTLSLHDALPIWFAREPSHQHLLVETRTVTGLRVRAPAGLWQADRKSTRLNSSHLVISYAVFCLKKKTRANDPEHPTETPALVQVDQSRHR